MCPDIYTTHTHTTNYANICVNMYVYVSLLPFMRYTAWPATGTCSLHFSFFLFARFARLLPLLAKQKPPTYIHTPQQRFCLPIHNLTHTHTSRHTHILTHADTGIGRATLILLNAAFIALTSTYTLTWGYNNLVIKPKPFMLYLPTQQCLLGGEYLGHILILSYM